MSEPEEGYESNSPYREEETAPQEDHAPEPTVSEPMVLEPMPMAEPGIYIWKEAHTQHPILGVLDPNTDCDFSEVTQVEALQAIYAYLESGQMEKVG